MGSYRRPTRSYKGRSAEPFDIRGVFDPPVLFIAPHAGPWGRERPRVA